MHQLRVLCLRNRSNVLLQFISVHLGDILGNAGRDAFSDISEYIPVNWEIFEDIFNVLLNRIDWTWIWGVGIVTVTLFIDQVLDIPRQPLLKFVSIFVEERLGLWFLRAFSQIVGNHCNHIISICDIEGVYDGGKACLILLSQFLHMSSD